MRLDAYLSHCGVGTRSECKKIIKQGDVKVFETVVRKSNFNVNEEKDLIYFRGRVLNYAPYYYYLFHKPKGYLTALGDRSQPTILDFFDEILKNQGVFPVGRLDKDTTGLLFLTSDGQWDHRLRHPKSEIEKAYLVKYEGELDSASEKRVSQGIDLGDFTTKPGKLERLGEQRVRLTIKEGKFHQVKRMIHALGGIVTELHRERIGDIQLDTNLAPGQWRSLTKEEVEGVVSRDECL